jgi:hypothetical protein
MPRSLQSDQTLSTKLKAKRLNPGRNVKKKTFWEDSVTVTSRNPERKSIAKVQGRAAEPHWRKEGQYIVYT